MNKYQDILNKYQYSPSNYTLDGDTLIDSSRFSELEKLDSQQIAPKKTIPEKIADFTGGKEISQGLGQAMTQRKTAKGIDETLKIQTDIQTGVLNAIKEKKAKGEDTSRLENALAMITEDVLTTGQGAEKLLNPNEITSKQVIGDALQLATTAGGAKVAGAVAGKATSATGVLKGALQGAKTGALTGVALGASTGASQGLQDDENAKEILASTVEGALLGGVTGGVLGGATGAVSGGVKARNLSKQTKHLRAVTPNVGDIKPEEYKKLVSQGRIQPKTATQPAQYILSEKELALAEKHKSILQSNDPVKNVMALADEVSRQDKKVGTFLEKNNGIFNTGELKNSLRASMEDIDDIAIPQERVNKLKDQLIENFANSVEKNDMKSLWQARKTFDQRIEKAFSGSPTLQKEAKKALRNSVQDFIADRTPDQVYKTAMKDMSDLIRLEDVVSNKAAIERKLGAIRLFFRNNKDLLSLLGGIGATSAVVGGGAKAVQAVTK